MKVADLMSRDVVTLHADSPMVDAEEVMGFRRLRHLPVVDGDLLVGIITHRDLMRHYLAPLQKQTWAEHQAHKARVKVREIMHKKVQSIASDADLAEAARIMHDTKFGCLPVIDGGKLVRILTEADFVHLAHVLLEHKVGDDAAAQAELEGWLAD